MAKEDTNTVVLCGGASIVTQTPLFSYDTKCLFCCSDRIIKIFSTSSGHCIRDLRGHTDHVTGIQLNPRNKFQIYSCSTDCSVIKWDYSDGIQLQKYDLHCPLYGLFSMSASEDAVLAVHRDLHQDHHLAKHSLKSGQDGKEHHKGKVIIRGCSPDNRHVAVGAQHKLVAAIMRKKLYIYSFKKDRLTVHSLGRKEPSFSCVTCHPIDHCVATGCSDGKIYLWWNVFSPKKVVKTINHWHALQVEHLHFTTEGSYLLSGGHECVLVKWQYNGHDRDFLPRIGASINHVICSPDNTLYATCHNDNVINLVSSSWKLVQTYQGLTRGHLSHQVADPVPTGLLRDPRSNAFVLNGKPGHLQFYDIRRDKQMFNLDITGQNYISPTNLNQPLVITEVRKAAFDHHGNWLATVEHWDDGELTPEMRLKFWQYNSESQSFVLNTNAEQPHNLQVTSLRFQPEWSEIKSVPRIVSSSQDGKFKIWELVDDTDIYRTNQRWSCERQGYYRDLPAGETAFAEDGSLLAVAFTSSLTLWDPDTNVMKAVFCHQGDTADIRKVYFGSRSCAHLLVSTTANCLTVWSLITCSVLWSVNVRIAVLVQDPLTHFMAAFTNDKDYFNHSVHYRLETAYFPGQTCNPLAIIWTWSGLNLNVNEDKGSAFSGFTGFSFKPTTDTTAKSTAGSGFSFASNASTSNGGNSSGFGASKLTGSVFGNKSSLDSSNSSKKTNSQYLQDLKSLNDSVLSWIKSHVDKNPFCILSPIFKDYEKHLSQLEKDYDKPGEKSTGNNELIHDTKPSQSIARNNVLSSEAKSSMSIADVKPSATFQFGSSLMKTDTTNASLENKPLFSFAVGKPQLTDSNADTGSSQEEEYVPPKPESSDIKEEGAVMTKRCKLFYQKEGVWTEKGVGNLHLKPLEDSRVQLVIRADTTLGNVLLNILLAKVIPLSREGKNNVSLFCVPNPPINPKADTSQPVQMLIRVKSGEEADELLAKMEELRN